MKIVKMSEKIGRILSLMSFKKVGHISIKVS